ncbi:unnamed protein product [Acanthoscelides obtectus]|uniref:Uncharacterized protein n=1 Tax=Acanthoscelides obtectus TaxID=200917 RepID=A0A9P0L478_ACAOB|nr:unnamed protein product [Acanthoscelides obtectus]CAK1627417.1 hypothetical protein AOBTE_LOCUS4586 [Acanthoscelides obtectus]
MATPAEFVTLGELFLRNCGNGDEEVFEKIKLLIEDTLPNG